MPSMNRYVYLTDGSRSVLLRVVTWSGDDIYLTDPENPGSGKLSYHASGTTLLGQPGYSPDRLERELLPPTQVHRYQSILHSRLTLTGTESTLDRVTSYPQTARRKGPVIDLRSRPEGCRVLQIEIGLRCKPSCHPDARIPSNRPGLVQEVIEGKDHDVLISAWWAEMGMVRLRLPSGEVREIPVLGDMWPLDS
jgi:hypothetical protein